jgi:hypothetical protein
MASTLRADTDDVGTVSSKPFTPPGAQTTTDRLVLDFDDAADSSGLSS